MTRYEWFEAGHGKQALELGIISTAMFAQYINYKMYLDARKAGKTHMIAIEDTAEEAKTSITTMWKAVYFFGKPNPTTV